MWHIGEASYHLDIQRTTRISQPQSDQPPLDGLPITILNYGNGPNRVLHGSRVNLTGVDTGAKHYLPESAIPLAYETHSAEDVGI
ncbi:intestinal-type alkaline phosphatase-like [Mizuhopecten yessoensis]|uniref:intestinal-type alkaline phosphatase-like n=1 Tax=Mizuhopecten yessoensis TaxID=6573 RepID=UPI000B45E05C|nr:intestinal-type alkaline phosphatase-like [Mizuhopecten yessoensis]